MSAVNYFALVAISIFLEALPFLLLGSLLSSCIEVYVPQRVFDRFIPKGKTKQVLAGLCIGFIIPSCECGIVPVARRLIKKGMPISMAITYMLAAPVINPLVIISTLIAFQGSLSMVFMRVGVVSITALITAFIIEREKDVLRDGVIEHHKGCGCCHGHSSHEEHEDSSTKWTRLFAFLDHTVEEFIDMGKYLIIGSFIAAAFKTSMPREMMNFIAANNMVSIAFMMLFAVAISVCSEADAFVAASFVKFSKLAQLSFITLGPMVDVKLIAMWSGTFRRKIVLLLIWVPVIVQCIIYYGLSLIGGN
jgi:uncharacterized membrane protein YraQ (UPF0718 family)